MKLTSSFLLVLSLLFFAACQSPTETAEAPEAETGFEASPQEVDPVEVETLEIGAEAPDFRLPGVDGNFYELADFADSDALAIVFTANHCPTAQAYEERMKQIVEDYQDESFSLVAISPNSPLALLLEELGYSDLGDTYQEMKIRARDHDFNFPYLYDGDTASFSVKYGPVTTPHAFVFNAERKLQYVGRIDDSEKPGTGNAEDLRAAIDAVLAGEEPELQVTKAFGCSVKWPWQTDWREQVNREWREKPVTLDEIDEEGIEQLLANDSGHLRLINVWATWCGPCVIEYPTLIEIHRMYSGRDFEFVSLSADSPENREDVLEFLQEKESSVTNFLFAKDDQYALIEALDPEWSGTLPYTMLLEPGGEVVYRHEGAIDPLELKRTIVDHELMGRYY